MRNISNIFSNHFSQELPTFIILNFINKSLKFTKFISFKNLQYDILKFENI